MHGGRRAVRGRAGLLGRSGGRAVRRVVALALAAAAAAAACSGGEEERVAIERKPLAWRVVYRLEEAGSDRSSRDEVWVRRPFDSRLETDGQATQVASFALRHAGVVLELPPGTAPSDVRLDAVLDAALDAGVIERRGVKTVAGRRCQVYRSRELLSAVRLRKPTDDDHADSCVDAAGLVLEEVLVAGGGRVSRRVATEVEELDALPDERFAIDGEPVGVRQGGGSVRELAPGSRPPGTFHQLDEPPAGFTHKGRYSVIPPQPENFSDPLREGHRRAAVVDVWVRGVDFVAVEQGSTLRGAPPFEYAGDSPRVGLGDLGRGEVVLSAQEPAVRVLLGGGRYVRVAGTLPPGRLAAIARRLRPVEGGELRFLDDA